MHQLSVNVSQNFKSKVISSAYDDLALLLHKTNSVPSDKRIYSKEKGEFVTKETNKPSVKKLIASKNKPMTFVIYSSIYSAVQLESVQGFFKFILGGGHPELGVFVLKATMSNFAFVAV